MPTIADSVCPLDCPDTCSLSVSIDADTITKIDASPTNPLTDGFICAKVRNYAQRIYSPDRIAHPLRRVGDKGSGSFEPISWDTAIAEIAARLKHIISHDGAHAILPFHYGGSNGLLSDGAADARFFHALGASRLAKTVCAAPTGAAVGAMYGGMCGVPMDDYPRARCILVWGANPSETSIHLMATLLEARRQGAFLVVIDPRRTKTAANADLHLAPRPGTDTVLAMAMAAELIRRGHTDDEFVRAHVNGYDDFRSNAAGYSIEDAAQTCDVPSDAIRKLVEVYAASSPAVIRCGWGVERNRNGGRAVRAILSLPAIAGKFGVRGGGFTMSMSKAFPIDADAVGRPDLQPNAAREINMSRLGRVLTEPIDPPVRALFVYNCNPVAILPDQNRVKQGLRRDDLFTVVHEQVMTDTAMFADIVLPATTVFEQSDLHKAYGHTFLQTSDPIIPPFGESISNGELFARLARAMNLPSPELFTEDSVSDAVLSRLSASQRDELEAKRILSVAPGGEDGIVQMKTVFPKTASGKIELAPPGLGRVTFDPPTGDYPFTLLSPATNRTINSIFGEFNLLDPRVDMHPQDAGELGLTDGTIVRIYNDLGEVIVPLRISESVRKGVLSLPKGLWARSTSNGATANALVPDHLSDYGAGACFNDARVAVARA